MWKIMLAIKTQQAVVVCLTTGSALSWQVGQKAAAAGAAARMPGLDPGTPRLKGCAQSRERLGRALQGLLGGRVLLQNSLV